MLSRRGDSDGAEGGNGRDQLYGGGNSDTGWTAAAAGSAASPERADGIGPEGRSSATTFSREAPRRSTYSCPSRLATGNDTVHELQDGVRIKVDLYSPRAKNRLRLF